MIWQRTLLNQQHPIDPPEEKEEQEQEKELDNKGFSADDDKTFDDFYSQATNPSDGYDYKDLLDYVFDKEVR